MSVFRNSVIASRLLAVAVLGLPFGAGAAKIVVTTLADDADPNTCSLRDAVRSANTNAAVTGCQAGDPGLDTIVLAAGTYILSIDGTGEDDAVTGDLDVLEDLLILGAAAEFTIVDGGALDRVLQIGAPGNTALAVVISDLTIRNGRTPMGENGGGILNYASGSLDLERVVVTANATVDSGDAGVGIFNLGILNIRFSEVSENSGAGAAGIFNENGGTLIIESSRVTDNTSPIQAGGIDNQGTLGILRSLIAGNTATLFKGGGIFNAGTLQMRASTLSGNTSGEQGGALHNEPGATSMLLHVTVADNGAILDGGGIHNEGTVMMDHTIVASNAGGNCSGPNQPMSQGWNLEDGNSCNLNQTGDQINTDPLLEPLRDNGGFTLTHALSAGSPAIDAGDGSDDEPDQRWSLQSADGNGDRIPVRDIGAFELQFPIVVNTTGDGTDALDKDFVCEVAVGSGLCSLRAAVQTAEDFRFWKTIQLGPGTHVLSIPGLDDTGLAGDLDVNTTIAIVGAGVDQTVIESQVQDRVLDARRVSGSLIIWLELRNLTVRGGSPSTGNGGCIRYDYDTLNRDLILDHVRLTGCTAAASGGALYLGDVATATVTDSSIEGSQAVAGGGISGQFSSRLVMRRSLVRGNEATSFGGGLNPGLLTLVNSTVSGNIAADFSGALFTNNVTFIGSSTIANNSATGGEAGGLLPGSQLFVSNSIIADNVGDPGSENCSGAGPSVFFSRGFNLESGNSCALSGTNDRPNADPRLKALADNGGPTLTHALTTGSDAIDQGDDATCPPTDQRGQPRPQDNDGDSVAACNIGAFEGSTDVLFSDGFENG